MVRCRRCAFTELTYQVGSPSPSQSRKSQGAREVSGHTSRRQLPPLTPRMSPSDPHHFAASAFISRNSSINFGGAWQCSSPGLGPKCENQTSRSHRLLSRGRNRRESGHPNDSRFSCLLFGQCQLVVRRPETALRVTGSPSTRRYICPERG